MDKFIQEIVSIDRECAKSVEEATKMKNEVQTNMNAKRKEIYDSYMAEQQEIIAQKKQELQAQIDATKSQNEKEFKDSLASLENLYNTKKDTWVDTIVNRCKEI